MTGGAMHGGMEIEEWEKRSGRRGVGLKER